jgi:hypothetical protein
VNFLGCANPGNCDNGTGLEITYCLPIVFPGIDFLFTTAKANNPCEVTSTTRNYRGIGIKYQVLLPREPVQM